MRKLLILCLAALSFGAAGQARKVTAITSATATAGKKALVISNSSAAGRKAFSITLLSKGRFSYELPGPAITSAGVFDGNGRLIRTLWNGADQAAGKHERSWLGQDDAGVTRTSGTCQIRIQVSPKQVVKATWDGVVGNNSDSLTGASKWHNLTFFNNVFVAGNYAYVSTHEGEFRYSTNKFLLTAPGKKIPVPVGFAWNFENCQFIAADNNRVYWLMRDPISARDLNLPKQGVVATNRTTDAVVTFPSGTTVLTRHNGVFTNVADYTENPNAEATGLAVQKLSNFLIVAHGGVNEVRVLNKTSGALVQTNTSLVNPRALAIDASDRLWITHGSNSVTRFTINGSGTLTNDGVTLSGLVAPMALGISQNGALISVCDGGASQQIKTYSVSNGALQNTFGQAGGYATSATVSNDKFYFSDVAGRVNKTSISYGPNGDFWVVDAGNNRLQHFDQNRAFIGRVTFQERSYNIALDHNDRDRLYRGFMEFFAPLSQSPADATLIRNYGAQVPAAYSAIDRQLYDVNTLSNGRTYGLSHNVPQNQAEVVELTLTGLRFTGVFLSYTDTSLKPDGSLWTNPAYSGTLAPYQFTRRALTGFDSAGNPQWGGAVVMGQITNPNPTDDPLYRGVPENLMAGELVNGRIVVFNGQGAATGNSTYRIGLVAVGGTDWAARTAKATGADHQGNFATDGYFETGNEIINAGSKALAAGDYFVVGHRGENYRGGQTNIYQVWSSQGLLVYSFGVLAPAGLPDLAQAGREGNAYAMQLITHPTDPGKLILYHGGEAIQSGISRWTISGLNSVYTQSVNVTLPVTDSKPDDPRGIDLLQGLPMNSLLTSGVGGWVRNPTGEDNTSNSQKWNVNTIGYSYDRPALYAYLRRDGTQTSGTVSYDLGNVTSSSYTVHVDIGSARYGQLDYSGAGSYFEILDNAGKIIARYNAINTLSDGARGRLVGNGSILFDTDYISMQRMVRDTRPVKITINSSGVTFTVADGQPITAPLFDTSADRTKPKTIRLFLQTGPNGAGSDKQVVVTRLYFKAN